MQCYSQLFWRWEMWYVTTPICINVVAYVGLQGTKHKFRRFGTGIYTTACSSSEWILYLAVFRFSNVTSEADDYTLNGDESSKLRVLLVSRVIVGNPHKRRLNATNLTEPPCGHHSVLRCFSYMPISDLAFQVIGEPGADLNYEETVVYNNDAIRPAYLVVYGEMPISKSKFHSFITALFKTPLASWKFLSFGGSCLSSNIFA